eukprot:344807-Hanusia_phi.AAC.19
MDSRFQMGSNSAFRYSESTSSFGTTPRNKRQYVHRKIRRNPYDGHEMKVLGELLIAPFDNPIAKGMFAGDLMQGNPSPIGRQETDMPDPHIDYQLCANTGNTPIAWYFEDLSQPSPLAMESASSWWTDAANQTPSQGPSKHDSAHVDNPSYEVSTQKSFRVQWFNVSQQTG